MSCNSHTADPIEFGLELSTNTTDRLAFSTDILELRNGCSYRYGSSVVGPTQSGLHLLADIPYLRYTLGVRTSTSNVALVQDEVSNDRGTSNVVFLTGTDGLT